MKSYLCNQTGYCSAPENRCGLNTVVSTTVIYEHLMENWITDTFFNASSIQLYLTHIGYARSVTLTLPYFSTEYSCPCISLVHFSVILLLLNHMCHGIIPTSENGRVQLNPQTKLPGVLIWIFLKEVLFSFPKQSW